MQKRMLYVSRHIGTDKSSKLSLWKGQCSCAYWHGIFGGLYLPHLRSAIYENLIEAENHRIHEVITKQDFNADGEDEIIYSDKNFFMVINPATASFTEIDERKQKINILNFIGRRKETYHDKISQQNDDKAVKSIHEIVQSKDINLTDHVVYDTYARSFFLDRILDHTPTIEDFRRGYNLGDIVQYEKHSSLKKIPLRISFSGKIRKTMKLEGSHHRTLSVLYEGDAKLFGVEFSMGVFNNNLRIDADKPLRKIQRLDSVDTFTINADNLNPITFRANKLFMLYAYPIETVSSSEAGFEKIFQGFCILLVFNGLPIILVDL